MALSSKVVKKLKTLYIDENVSIFLKDMNVVTVNEESQEIRISQMCDGYVIDIDEEFFYLGLPDGTVIKTVPHSTVGLVELVIGGGQMMDLDIPSDGDIH